MANMVSSVVDRLKAAAGAFRYPADFANYGGGMRGLQVHGDGFLRNLEQFKGDLNEAIASTDPALNRAVMCCLGWVMDVWPESKIRIYKITPDGNPDEPEKETVPSKDIGVRLFQEILRRPCAEQSADQIWKATAMSLKLDGNAYWLKLRSSVHGGVIGYRFVPHHLIYPWWPTGGNIWIQEYRYYPGSAGMDPIKPEDIVHFRDGIDPKNTRLGMSRLKSGLTEIFTDDELGRYLAAMAFNMGPAFGVSPDPVLWSGGKPGIKIDEEEGKRTKKNLERATRGSKRGSVVVSSMPWKYDQLGVTPDKMAIRENRFTPEETICSLMGVSASVAKLGAGLERNTFNNAALEEEQSYRRGVMPVQRVIKDTLDLQALPDFTDDESFLVDYDLSQVRALQEDQDAKSKRYVSLFVANLADRYECKTALDMPADEKVDRVYSIDLLRGGGTSLLVNPDGSPAGKRFRGQKKRANKLTDAVAEYRNRLVAKDQALTAELGAYLQAAEDAIQQKWDALATKIAQAQEAGDQIGEGWLMLSAHYRQLHTQIESEMQRFADLATVRTTEQQTEFSVLAADAAESMTGAIAEEAAIEATFTSLPNQTIHAFAGFASDGSPLRTLFDDLGPDLSKAARERIVQAIATGEPAQSLAKGLTPMLGGNRARAMNIARTEPHRAAAEVQRLSYLQNSAILDGWIRLSAGDARTCAACFAQHGTKHKLGDPLEEHCQGRCVMVPSVKGANQTYPTGQEMFDRLTEDQQSDVLQHLYDPYKNGDITLADAAAYHHDDRFGGSWQVANTEQALANADARALPRAG